MLRSLRFKGQKAAFFLSDEKHGAACRRLRVDMQSRSEEYHESQFTSIISQPAIEAPLREQLIIGLASLHSESSSFPIVSRSIPIYELGDESIVLERSLQVEIEIYKDEVLASIPELEIWASEDNESEAIGAVKREVVKLYRELIEEDDTRLGPLPRMWKRLLTQRIRRAVDIVQA